MDGPLLIDEETRVPNIALLGERQGVSGVPEFGGVFLRTILLGDRWGGVITGDLSADFVGPTYIPIHALQTGGDTIQATTKSGLQL